MVESNEHAQLREALEFCLEKDLERILLSNPSDPDHFSKSKIRPLLLKGNLIFQAESRKANRLFIKLSRDEAVIYVENCLNGPFRQAEITCARGKATVLVSKKGKMTVKFKKQARMINQATWSITVKAVSFTGRNSGSVSGRSWGYDKRRHYCPQPL